ncbi:hypothetical protein PR048_015172 [Dryococelus australis]|uniref:Uncharacterized protein n=1 Tax=Dryococelus australis TaxID=614101 RepID=A0ABQ9HGG2_9NEOP|nr:hypothetical protein PR048_015172 [Dryococelus australis]
MEQHWNEAGGETVESRENPPTGGIVRLDSHFTMKRSCSLTLAERYSPPSDARNPQISVDRRRLTPWPTAVPTTTLLVHAPLPPKSSVPIGSPTTPGRNEVAQCQAGGHGVRFPFRLSLFRFLRFSLVTPYERLDGSFIQHMADFFLVPSFLIVTATSSDTNEFSVETMETHGDRKSVAVGMQQLWNGSDYVAKIIPRNPLIASTVSYQCKKWTNFRGRGRSREKKKPPVKHEELARGTGAWEEKWGRERGRGRAGRPAGMKLHSCAGGREQASLPGRASRSNRYPCQGCRRGEEGRSGERDGPGREKGTRRMRRESTPAHIAPPRASVRARPPCQALRLVCCRSFVHLFARSVFSREVLRSGSDRRRLQVSAATWYVIRPATPLNSRWFKFRRFITYGIVPDDAVGPRVFSGVSRFHRPFIPAPLHIHFNNPLILFHDWYIAISRSRNADVFTSAPVAPATYATDVDAHRQAFRNAFLTLKSTLHDKRIGSEEIWLALNSEVLRANEGEVR